MAALFHARPVPKLCSPPRAQALKRAVRAAPTPRHGAVGARRLVVNMAQKKRNSHSYVRTVSLKCKEGNREKVMAVLTKYLDDTHAHMAISSDHGIEVFECQEDSFEPGTFHFWERYVSLRDMAIYMGHQRTSKFENEMLPLLEGPGGAALYEERNGILGPCTLPIGPEGEGGLDDAAGGNKGTGGGARLEQTSKAMMKHLDHYENEGNEFGMDKMLQQQKEMEQQMEDAVASAKSSMEDALKSAKEKAKGMLGGLIGGPK